MGPASCWVAPSKALPARLRGRVLELSGLHVEPERRHEGWGTALMRLVCAEADAEGAALLLCVEPSDSTMSREQLAAWYASHGFTQIQAEPLLMARPPKQTT
jgi:ribosomal protein S18 acetylase RimI-like enzyme